MGKDSSIEWTDHTFSPWRGCTKVSAGCTNCYAEAMSKRNPGVLGVWGDNGTRVVAAESYWRQPLKWDRQAGADGVRRRVFCASISDVFEDRPELVAPRARLWQTILYTPNLDWLLLTKRPENVVNALRQVYDNQRARAFRDDCLAAWIDGSHPPDNVWLGTSVENQATADERIPHLINIPAAVRFLSCEPLLGPVNLYPYLFDPHPHREHWPHERRDWLHWIICGGESGPKARPCDLSWIRSIRDQCREAGVSYFCKQLGAKPQSTGRLSDALVGAGKNMTVTSGLVLRDSHGGNESEWPPDLQGCRAFPAPVRSEAARG